MTCGRNGYVSGNVPKMRFIYNGYGCRIQIFLRNIQKIGIIVPKLPSHTCHILKIRHFKSLGLFNLTYDISSIKCDVNCRF